jgi:hypothetical protein
MKYYLVGLREFTDHIKFCKHPSADECSSTPADYNRLTRHQMVLKLFVDRKLLQTFR